MAERRAHVGAVDVVTSLTPEFQAMPLLVIEKL
jgi:hypothetical protein